MSEELHDRYARLLRWYPSDWIRRHGESAIAALMDQADDQGRDRPTAQEARELARAGVALRLRRSLPPALLPVAGAVFAVLWIVAEAGRSYPGSSPWIVAMIVVLLGTAIGASRARPVVAMSIAGAILIAQLVYGPIRFANTSWPLWLAVIAVIAVAGSSSSKRVRTGALVLAVAGGLSLAALAVFPLPSVGLAVPAPFHSVLMGTYDGVAVNPLLGTVAICATALAASFIAWVAGTLMSRSLTAPPSSAG
ncbi:hypothetical protein NY547_08285 [Cnuibacter physcomitrellae]|uniref:hypothetical protein n=1 Tax=Cnuibacter physcomitrellae TaxID=1619308 RepID=UPI002175D341|nr:hypothetical protein [Cnuibacter physcomitrellae]MCS5497229.1 hypothetical protein [Cnuibacter physcomitrellae]